MAETKLEAAPAGAPARIVTVRQPVDTAVYQATPGNIVYEGLDH
jgi:hypothetical protein